jgi:3-phenylpropionate/trans-cinnamate dioxygenase ferredoxin reductase subunit
MADARTYVIVGAGLAGAKAAEGLRDAGFEGRVVLVGSEPEQPYERPPLSKGLLLGESERSGIFVQDETWWAEHDVELVDSTAVTGLDRDARTVQLAGRETLGYDRVLLATGAVPRRLELPGSDLGGIFHLRTVHDSEALGEALRAGGHVVVVGAGWIGLEVAAAARHHGADVTVVEPQPTPLHGVLGAEVGERFAALHRANGVDLRLGAGVDGFEGTGGRVAGVRVDGSVVEADAVVVGVGVRPETRLAEEAGLEVDNGVVVDELLRTSDPAVLAAGDVANAWHPVLGERVRVEHWANALNQGFAAGRSMADRGEPYERLPYFFTDQYDLGMEYHGHAGSAGWDQVVLRGATHDGQWMAFWLREDRLLAAMHVNCWDDADAVKALARARPVVSRSRLADPEVPLDQITPS